MDGLRYRHKLLERFGFMPGSIDHEYFWNPNMHATKSMPEIYADFDRVTDEIALDETERHHRLDAWVLLPPLHFGGKLLKGILVSTSIDLLLHLRPELKELFILAVSPRWCGYPWSRQADVVFSSYDNPVRDAWFRETYPDRAHQLLMPYDHEMDFTDEYWVSPSWAYAERDIDVVTVSRFSVQKNIPMMVEAAMIYRDKYNRPDFHMALIIGKDLDGPLTDEDRDIMQQVDAVLERYNGMIETVGVCSYNHELFDYYRHAKVFALGSILEGKNRAQREALYCNTPVTCFQAFNQYARGTSEVFPDGCGLMVADFDAEAMADTWHIVHQNQDAFTPRKSILRDHGRKRVLNQLMAAIPYYAQSLEDFNPEAPSDSTWIEIAIQTNYQASVYDFLYTIRPTQNHTQSLDATLALADFYLELFGLPHSSLSLAATA